MKKEITEEFLRKNKISDLGRWYTNQFVISVSKEVENGKFLLDAGAGECAYKGLFRHLNYKSIDLAVGDDDWNYSHLDFKGFLHQMPIDNDSFDYILCTQVLEHLELPFESLTDMNRVLKKGGKIFISVPFHQNEHQTPYDYFRYTSHGLNSLLERSGFTNIVIKPFGGMFVRWAWELPRMLSHLPKMKIENKIIYRNLIFILPVYVVLIFGIRICQLVLIYIDRFDKKKHDTLGWSATAIKH